MATNKKHKNIKQKAKPTNPSSGNWKILLLLSIIAIITYVSYSPALKNNFTNWDDPVYVIDNTLITHLSAENIKQIFTSIVSCNYHPLTVLSNALEYKVSGLTPAIYHRNNIYLHVINTLLVFWFIFLLSGKRIEVAGIVSLFFGIHPMHVESVAWISERKDVLYTFFFIAALIVYYKYISSETKRTAKYLLVFLLFILSLLSKAVAVTLPIVMLLMDYYTNRTFTKKVIIEKIPFLILSVIFGIASIKAQATAAIADFGIFTVPQRFMFASYGMLNYIFKLFWPLDLSAFYPYPFLINNRLPIIFYASPFVLLALFFLVYKSIKYSKVLVFGFLFFLINIALVLQFISVGQVIVADRYSYVPYIGLLFSIGMGYSWLKNHKNATYRRFKNLVLLALISSAGVASYLTFQRCKVWKNSDTLWTDVINKYPKVEVAYKNRGNYYAYKRDFEKEAEKNEYEKALKDYNVYISMNQSDSKIYSNRGNLFGLQGKFDLALADYSMSISLDKNNKESYINRAITYSMMKQYEKAFEDYDKVLTISPDFLKVYQNRGYAYLEYGDYNKSLADYNYLISKTPQDANAYFYRALCYYNMKNYPEAIKDNTTSIELNPNNSGAFYNRSAAFNAIKNYKKALEDALQAKSMGYNVDQKYIDQIRKEAEK